MIGLIDLFDHTNHQGSAHDGMGRGEGRFKRTSRLDCWEQWVEGRSRLVGCCDVMKKNVLFSQPVSGLKETASQ